MNKHKSIMMASIAAISMLAISSVAAGRENGRQAVRNYPSSTPVTPLPGNQLKETATATTQVISDVPYTVTLSPTVAPSSGEPQTEPASAKIIQATKQYERTLTELATKAQDIVNAMPGEAGNLAKNFGELGEVLMGAKKHLMAILKVRPELEAQAGNILTSTAGIRQQFSDMEAKIDAQILDIQTKDNGKNPTSIAAGIQMLQSVKTACKNGQLVMVPVRDQVIGAQLQAKSIFAEIELYPGIFDTAIEACELYQKGIGDSADYVAVVQGLAKARDNLRLIIVKFTEAAQKAEEMIKKMPNPANQDKPGTSIVVQ